MGKKDDTIFWRLYDFLNGDTDESFFPEYNFEKFIREYNISDYTTMEGTKRDWLALLVILSTRYWNSDPRIEDDEQDPPTGDDILESDVNGQVDEGGDLVAH